MTSLRLTVRWGNKNLTTLLLAGYLRLLSHHASQLASGIWLLIVWTPHDPILIMKAAYYVLGFKAYGSSLNLNSD